MNLSREQLVALTGKKYVPAQIRELEHLHIPYKRRRDGSLLVLRIHVETGQTHEIRDDNRQRPRVRFDA